MKSKQLHALVHYEIESRNCNMILNSINKDRQEVRRILGDDLFMRAYALIGLVPPRKPIAEERPRQDLAGGSMRRNPNEEHPEAPAAKKRRA